MKIWFDVVIRGPHRGEKVKIEAISPKHRIRVVRLANGRTISVHDLRLEKESEAYKKLLKDAK